VDLATLVAQKDDLVDALRQEKYTGLVDAYGFEVRPAAVLIATGASPAAPPIPGLYGDRRHPVPSDTARYRAVPRHPSKHGANMVAAD
jgi:hypothetical protein